MSTQTRVIANVPSDAPVYSEQYSNKPSKIGQSVNAPKLTAGREEKSGHMLHIRVIVSNSYISEVDA